MSLIATTSQVVNMMPLAADSSGRWFSNPVITNNLLDATLETIYMSLWAGLFSILLGLPIGLLLVATAPAGLLSGSKVARVLYAVLGFIVNVGRSLPFIILMISIIPFTRLLVGTTLGWKAAVVPLTLAAAPFFARLVESNVQGVDSGKLEAAKMAGGFQLADYDGGSGARGATRSNPISYRHFDFFDWLRRDGGYFRHRRSRRSRYKLWLQPVYG